MRLDKILFSLRALFGLRQKEAELDDELRFHLDMEIEKRVASGQSRRAATRAARLEFGPPEAIKEACRDTWGVRLVDETRRDLRSGVRHWLSAPGFALAVIGSLAIGLGAATVLFGIVDTVLLRPLPYDEPERIVVLHELTPEGNRFSASDLNLIDFRDASRSLEHIAAMAFPSPRPALGLQDGRRRVQAEAVSPAFFAVLGVEARIGRTFSPADDRPGVSPAEVVLTDQAWRRYFGADTELVGQSIDLDGEATVVVGVLPAEFRLEPMPELFVPYTLNPSVVRGDHRLTAYARLADGYSFEQASDEVAAIAMRLAEEYPETNRHWSAELQPIEDLLLGGTTRRTQLILLGVVALLLVITCANVSHLFLVRASDRRQEIDLRLALGARRGRVVRQLVTEALVLGAVGAACALALAWWAIPVVRGLEVPMPRIDTLQLDWRVFAFSALVAAVASLVGSLLPSIRATQSRGLRAARGRSHGGDVGDRRLRSGLVIAEIALAMVLTAGSGLLLHSFTALQDVDSGFAADGVLLAQIDLPPERYPMHQPQPTGEFYKRLVDRVRALPGVDSAAATMVSPYRGPQTLNDVADETEHDPDAFFQVHWRAVTADAFQVLGVPLQRGRSFLDRGDRRMEAVVSANLAARLWPGRDPIGQRIRWIDPEGPLFEVVGVAADVQDLQLGSPPPMTVYAPQEVIAWSTMTLAIRSSVALESLTGPVADVVAELDPLLAPPGMSTLAGQREAALAQPLLGVQLLSVASLIAVVLAAIGVFGVISYAVSRRQREMGVRVAMGARPRQLVRLLLADGLRLVGLGVGLGLVVSLALVETLRAILYETSPFDLGVLASATAVLAVVGLLAGGLPALRVARLDPISVLRQDG